MTILLRPRALNSTTLMLGSLRTEAICRLRGLGTTVGFKYLREYYRKGELKRETPFEINVVSKLYGINATVMIYVLVLYCNIRFDLNIQI